MASAIDTSHIYEKVLEGYSSAAKVNDNIYGRKVAIAFGYSEAELASIPQDANLGLSCGNPLVMATLREGETVVDLGCGAGFDALLAAKKVGQAGKVIGVDMNKDMLERAERNKEKSSAANVEFVESKITNTALPSGEADCIISNCVINLVPEQEKQLVFNEIYRLLKPGGRVAINDILTKHELPPEAKNNVALYLGCIAGASLAEDYEKYFREAGFSDVLIVDTKSDLNIYATAKVDTKCCVSSQTKAQTIGGCCSNTKPTVGKCYRRLDDTGGETSQACCHDRGPTTKTAIENMDLNGWAGSFKIYAVKAKTTQNSVGSLH